MNHYAPRRDWQSMCFVALAILAGCIALFFIVDVAGARRGEADQATVINRAYHAAYTTTRRVTDGDGNTRTVRDHHPERFVVTVSSRDGVDDYEVSGSSWPLFKMDAPCTRWERRGWITGWRYGHSLTPITVDLGKTE